jgi:4-amino-4-deoxy-L-arabinose transferase-like glycosyltransferase
MMRDRHNAVLTALCILVAVFAAFIMIYRIGDLQIRNWDEARHGVSAIEAVETGNYLVNTFLFEPDYYNVKPPLSFATMVAGVLLFGKSMFGIRFFSALCALTTLLLSMTCCARRFGKAEAALTGAILATAFDFIMTHHARTADPDALYVLFHTAAVLLVLRPSASAARYCLASLLAALAFLTKSFHAGSLVITLIALFVMDNKASRRSIGHGLGCCLIFLVPVALWAAARYQYDGLAFFEKMVLYDLMQRASEVIENHAGGPFFYFRRIYADFKPLMHCAAILFILFFLQRRFSGASTAALPEKNQLARLCLVIVIPLLLFSLSKSKLPWYLYGAYPFIGMLLSVLLVWLARNLYSFRACLGHAAVALIVIFILDAGRRTWREISTRIDHADSWQVSIRDIGEKNKGRAVFAYRGDDRPWEQAHELAGKIYSVTLMPGGRQAFTASDKANKALVEKDGGELVRRRQF